MSAIALIFGGPSAEHDVSLASAKNIFQVLKDTPHQIYLLGITRLGEWKLIQDADLLSTSFVTPLDLTNVGESIFLVSSEKGVEIQRKDSTHSLDVAFPIIHGPYGEDGRLQKELQQLGLPFVGTDFDGCKKSFDKELTKKAVATVDIPQVPWLSSNGEPLAFDKVVNELGLPFFLKPANMGSSLGISKVKNEEAYKTACEQALSLDKKLVYEKAVTAREIEVALLERDGLEVTGPGEVRPLHEFYSYEAKYIDANGAELLIPAPVEADITKKIQDYAVRCFEVLECRDFSRADFFLLPDGQIFFNEINTHPGFTNISQFPMLWQQEGLAYKDLILLLVDNALKRKK